MRHINIPIFIPHLGCPNTCVFCNQRTISGVDKFEPDSVRKIIDENLSSISHFDEVEIAFFGGSFTGIDQGLMVSLLEIAYSYIEEGKVKSIRCSTRPDYISEEILLTLKKFGVKTVELGLQSSDDRVLKLTKRGHDFSAEKKACDLIVKHGFDLVGQMMIGLPGSDIETEIATAEFIVSSGAKGARIYPTVVFHETELCQMAQKGEYIPLSLDEAIERSARVLEIFSEAGVDVIRIGLCSSDNLLSDKTYYAGPNHSALGELVIGEFYYKKILKKLSDFVFSDRRDVEIVVSPGAISKAIGQKRKNKIRLLEDSRIKSVRFTESADVTAFDILIKILNGDL